MKKKSSDAKKDSINCEKRHIGLKKNLIAGISEHKAGLGV
jgi:hypothetical protein